MHHLVDKGRTEGVNLRKMGSITPKTDCHHDCHCQQGQHNNDDLHNHDHCGGCRCFVEGSCSNRGAVSATILTCPLRGITNNNDDVSHDGEEQAKTYHVCDTNCPSICYNNATTCDSDCPCLISCGNNSSSPTVPCASITTTTNTLNYFSKNNTSRNVDHISRCSSRRIGVENSFNDNIDNSSRSSKTNDDSRLRRHSGGNSNSINCANGNSDNHKSKRISRSGSLLTGPCALYLFSLLVILDLSDFSRILITSSYGRTASDSSEVLNNVLPMMKRYNGFLVNGAFNDKNGHQHGFGGLTVSPEVPILGMDSVFFDYSIGNQLTGSSESAEEGENISHEQEEEDIREQQTLFEHFIINSGEIPDNPKEPSYSWKGRENHIKFNLDSIPSMEQVTGAELRIPFVITVSSDGSETVNSASFRESGADNHVVDNGLAKVDKDKEQHQHHGQLKAVRILLCDVTKPATSPQSKKPTETHLLEPITYPIDSKTVILSKRRNGTSTIWLTFDVFPAVARWMSNPKLNHGLVLEMHGVTNEGHTVPQEIVVQRHNLRVKRDVAENQDYENSVDRNEGRSSSETSGGSGKVLNSITTESSSSSSSSSTTSATVSSSKTTHDSGESRSSSTAKTPTSSSVVSSSASSSPTEVGVATDDGFISSNNEMGKKKKAGDTSSSIVLFTYSDDGHNPVKTRDAKTLSRHYRSAQNQKRRKSHRNKNRKRNLCQRHAMFVDFQDVGWNDWIVAPPGYAAFYCSGECPFPMAEHLNATNHAVIQALVHSMNPALVPPPCCVPTKYSSLSLLYTDSSDKIVLKNYNEMVVDSCGCS